MTLMEQITLYPGYTDAEATAPPVGRPPAGAYDLALQLNALEGRVTTLEP